MTYWTSENDVDDDMMVVTEFNSKLPIPSKEPNKFVKNFKSIYDFDYDEDTQCKPIRGYPVNNHELINPGPLDKNDTVAQIRQVSGFGYSNDLIEHSLRETTEKEDNVAHKMKNLKFKSSNNLQGTQNFKQISENISRNISDTNKLHSPSRYLQSNQYYAVGNSGVKKPDINSRKDFPSL